MRGGIFEKMSLSKQVSFIERISKSSLGLEGMQIVVNSDKGEERKKGEFLTIGTECLKKVTGEKIKEKYGTLEAKQWEEKLHQERINWLKQKEKEKNN